MIWDMGHYGDHPKEKKQALALLQACGATMDAVCNIATVFVDATQCHGIFVIFFGPKEEETLHVHHVSPSHSSAG